MGDFNTKIGHEEEREFVGPHGLREKNAGGDRLPIFTANKKTEIHSLNCYRKDLKEVVNNVCDKFLKADNNGRRKTWMTNKVLQMMEQRRLVKHTDKYLEIHRQIQREIKVAKKKMQEDCQEIEALQRKYDA
ncbi:hypothetical protein Trydic_g7486 [Trypoxylus dichotomus]